MRELNEKELSQVSGGKIEEVTRTRSGNETQGQGQGLETTNENPAGHAPGGHAFAPGSVSACPSPWPIPLGRGVVALAPAEALSRTCWEWDTRRSRSSPRAGCAR